MAADTISKSDWHLKCKIGQMFRAAWNCHHFSFHMEMASYLGFGKIFCIHDEKIVCSIYFSSSLLCQEADEGSDTTLPVIWDSVVTKICYAQ